MGPGCVAMTDAAIGRTAFFIRAAAHTDVAADLAARLRGASGADPVFVCDDRAGRLDTGPFPRITLSPDRFACWGLTDLPANWGWFCGDLALYAAAEADPEAAFLCVMDADVWMDDAAAAALVDLFTRDATAALAAGLGPKPEPPKYSAGLADLGLDPRWGCLFPLVRVARDLVPAMQDLRRRSLPLRGRRAVNDEAVLAGAVQITGASHGDLAGHDLFSAETFATNPPMLFGGRPGSLTPGRVHHPVLTLDTVLDRIGDPARGYHRARLRRVLAAAGRTDRARIAARLAEVAVPDLASDPASARLSALSDLLGTPGPVEVVDVGANPIEGEVSYRRLLDLGLARVTGFEPQAEALEKLRQRQSPAETYLPDALGDGAPATLHLCREGGFTSLYAPDPASAAYLGFRRGMAVTGRQPVATARLDDLAAVPRADFLKIDVQGSETAIIAGGSDRLSQVLLVQTEMRFFPLYAGEPRIGALEAALTALGLEFYGFSFVKRVPPRSRYSRRIARGAGTQAVDGDVFFVRDLRGIDGWDTRAIARLALLADGAMAAFDLALYCLDALERRGAVTAEGTEAYIARLPDGVMR